jgi:cell division protein FtsL
MYAQKKPIENTHIVRERDRQRFRELFSVVVLGIFIGGFLIIFTWQNLSVIRLGHEATRLQQQRKELENANKALRLEVDRLTALASVEQRAGALGFEKSDPRAVVMVTREPLTVGRSPNLPTANGQRPTANAEHR